MVFKSKKLENLVKVFKILRHHKLHLNAAKCAFGMGSRKFLGYMKTCRRIEVNPDQIRAIQQLSSLSNQKEMQKLTWMIIALNRFVFKSADRCKPFFQLLRKWKGFQWTEKCDDAFQSLKLCLARPSILSSLEPSEDLYMYLAMSEHAVSAVLIRVQDRVQRLVYYVNKTLLDSETQYLPLEKMALALVHATRKLLHYFQAHIVYVLTQHPLQVLLRMSDFTGRIAKWGARLRFFDVRYKPGNAIKGQVLADFVAEFIPLVDDAHRVCQVSIRPWKVYVDGASNAHRAGIGILLKSSKGIKLEHSLKLGFQASNNEAGYKALVAGLRVARKLGAMEVEIYSDSRLVMN